MESNNYNQELKLKGFKVYQTDSRDAGHTYSRKDFYKINITTGRFIFNYADRSFETSDSFLFFGNPRIPYSCEALSSVHHGFTCLFTEEFLRIGERSESLQQSPLFRLGGTPILPVRKKDIKTITEIFGRMLVEQSSDYAFKDELIRNYINLIIHESLKIEPPANPHQPRTAAERITSVFLELLERQFPIENMDRPLELKTAKVFAESLFVHVNYLNASVKEITGKSTTSHIADRIITEAKALLQHTDWSISQIAYSLGFEYPTYFNNFFKKKTGMIPKDIRMAQH